MLNKQLFGAKSQTQDAIVNAAGGKAHAFDAKHALAQLALTGTMNDTYYADATSQLDELLARCFDVNRPPARPGRPDPIHRLTLSRRTDKALESTTVAGRTVCKLSWE